MEVEPSFQWRSSPSIIDHVLWERVVGLTNQIWLYRRLCSFGLPEIVLIFIKEWDIIRLLLLERYLLQQFLLWIWAHVVGTWLALHADPLWVLNWSIASSWWYWLHIMLVIHIFDWVPRLTVSDLCYDVSSCFVWRALMDLRKFHCLHCCKLTGVSKLLKLLLIRIFFDDSLRRFDKIDNMCLRSFVLNWLYWLSDLLTDYACKVVRVLLLLDRLFIFFSLFVNENGWTLRFHRFWYIF